MLCLGAINVFSDWMIKIFIDDVFEDEEELNRNTNAIKGGLDDVHRTQPQPAPMSSRITGKCAWLKGLNAG